MPEAIQEFVDSRSCQLRVDRQASVLKGVKLLGMQSRNGRVYREHALRSAIGLYEGSRVNVNHPKGDPLGARDYQDRLGVLRNVELRPNDGLYGALHFNPKHPLAEQLAWDAEHAPENVGLSHNVLANTQQQGEQLVVESIEHVQSVDLVADPATTSGLFEQALQSSAHGLHGVLQEKVSVLESEVAALRERVEEAEQPAVPPASPWPNSREQRAVAHAVASEPVSVNDFVAAITRR